MKEKSETTDKLSLAQGSQKQKLNSDLQPQPDDEVPKTLGEAKKGKFGRVLKEQ